MNKSLSDFATNFTPKEPPKQIQSPSSQPPENLEKTIQNLWNKPREELFLTLKNEVQQQKANGTFNLEKLENNLEILSPYLTQEQKKNIKELLKQI